MHPHLVATDTILTTATPAPIHTMIENENTDDTDPSLETVETAAGSGDTEETRKNTAQLPNQSTDLIPGTEGEGSPSPRPRCRILSLRNQVLDTQLDQEG
jgi:hypothetical protein